MQISGSVHSAALAKVPTELKLADGETITADLEVLVLEVVSDDPNQKNFTLVAPADHADAFKPKTRVTITLALENAK